MPVTRSMDISDVREVSASATDRGVLVEVKSPEWNLEIELQVGLALGLVGSIRQQLEGARGHADSERTVHDMLCQLLGETEIRSWHEICQLVAERLKELQHLRTQHAFETCKKQQVAAGYETEDKDGTDTTPQRPTDRAG